MGNLLKSTARFALLCMVVMGMMLVLRVCEWGMLRNTVNHTAVSFSNLYDILHFDYQTLATFSVLLLPVYLIARWQHWKWLVVMVKSLLVVFYFVHIGLTHFFLSTHVLLGANLFEFTWKEILFIAGSEFTQARLQLWTMDALLLGGCIFLLAWLPQKIQTDGSRLQIILLGGYYLPGMALLFAGHYWVKPIELMGGTSRYMVCNNKLLYLVVASYNKAQKLEAGRFNPEELVESIRLVQAEYPMKKFAGTDYPLWNAYSYPNVLGPYFAKSPHKPNIVFLLCESVSGSLVGEQSRYPGMMPFLDSLTRQSLYWPHFICSAPQTYGVLPNVLGSLPLGIDQRGFINLDTENYPAHNSMFSLLGNLGYTTRFFHGGWGHFDHMDDFLQYNKVSYVQVENQFDHTKNAGDANRRWGIADGDMFRKSFSTIPVNDNPPYLSVYLTLTFHSPFNMAPASYTNEHYVNQRLKRQGITKNQHLTNEGPLLLGSLFYTDDALRNFIAEYKKRPDYANTIFVLTGDHGMAMQRTLYHRFNVPLIIFSPMVTKPARFGGLSSQRDITPSLLALLSENFGVQIPLQNHWIGTGLDTSASYRCLKSEPMALYDEVYPQYIYQHWFGQNGAAFVADSTFIDKPTDANAVATKMARLCKAWEMVNRYVLLQNRLKPMPAN